MVVVLVVVFRLKVFVEVLKVLKFRVEMMGEVKGFGLGWWCGCRLWLGW